MKCITKEKQDYIFRLALWFEQKVFPDVLQGENKNHQVIPVTVVDKSFCDIDTKKTLANKGWKEFFYKMNKGIVKLKPKKMNIPFYFSTLSLTKQDLLQYSVHLFISVVCFIPRNRLHF